jgi:hypothetical protein
MEKFHFDSSDQLIERLQYEDKRYYGIIKRFTWLLIVMIPLYLGVFVLNPSSDIQLHDRLTGICYTLAFTVFFFIYRHYRKVFGNVNYGEPMAQLLKSLINRYKIKQAILLWTLIPIVLIDAGLCFSDIFRHTGPDMWKEILLIQAVYWPVMALSATIGFLIWRSRYKPLIDSAKVLLKELE